MFIFAQGSLTGSICEIVLLSCNNNDAGKDNGLKQNVSHCVMSFPVRQTSDVVPERELPGTGVVAVLLRLLRDVWVGVNGEADFLHLWGGLAVILGASGGFLPFHFLIDGRVRLRGGEMSCLYLQHTTSHFFYFIYFNGITESDDSRFHIILQVRVYLLSLKNCFLYIRSQNLKSALSRPQFTV